MWIHILLFWFMGIMAFTEISGFRSFEKTGNAARVRIAFQVIMFAFLGVNLWYRFSTIFDYSRFVGGLLVALAVFSLLVILFPKLLKVFLFFFGASFFLFGFRAYDIQSQVFETVVVFVVLTVFLVNLRSKESLSRNRHLMGLILCYIGLSAFSLLLLPVGHIVKDLWFFGLETSAQQFANATPNSPLYALGGFNRLALFAIMSFHLAATPNSRENFKFLFGGVFSGAVFCAIIGLLDFSGVISLKWYRLGTTHIAGVLHSTFLNRGWFSEFILSAVPFVLIGFISEIRYRWWKIMLFVSLVICEVVLILSGARAGWVSYPLVLFICWLFFYFTKDGGIKRSQFKWWNLIKVAVSVPVTIAISLLIVFQIVLPLSDALRDKTDVKGKGKDLAVTTGYLKKKAATMITASASSRPMRWKQGFNVGRENPVFGMGYESFRWHADILPGIEGSYCNRNVTSSFADTPHCIFYQLFVSGGIVGLCLWLLIVGYALMILIIDLVRNKRLLNIPVVISIISFHMYGIFQSMQYIPMIWSLIFLCLGYAMTIDEKVLPERVRRIVGVVVKVMICLVLIGGVVYFTDWGSQGLADKYGLQVYGKDQDRNNYLGFYPKEKGPQGIFRFSGKRGLIRVKEDGLLGIRFDCHTPGVDKEPVTVDISVDDQPVGRLTFSEIGPQKWHYWLKKMDEGSHEILIEVSRTWNPKESGVSLDYRDLGLAVGEPEFPKLFPVEGIGFYDWETWRGKPIPGWTGDEMKFRWMGAQAFIPIDLPSKMAYVRKYQRASEMEDQTKGGLQVFFRSFHPDVGTNPIVVEIFSDKMLSKKVTLKGKKWEKIAFDQNEIKDSKVLGFKVSRTWNPSLLGISEDRRDLGVAVVYRYGVVNAASRSF